MVYEEIEIEELSEVRELEELEQLFKESMFKLFVYGTLKRGYELHRVISGQIDSQFLGEKTIDDYTLYDIGCPIAIKEKGSQVNGEIWLVNKRVYKRIRNIELGAGYKEIMEYGLIFYIYPKECLNSFYCTYHIGSTWPSKISYYDCPTI